MGRSEAPRGTSCVSGVGGASPLPGACPSPPAAGGREGVRGGGGRSLPPRRAWASPPLLDPSERRGGLGGAALALGHGKVVFCFVSATRLARPSAALGLESRRRPRAAAPVARAPLPHVHRAAASGAGRRSAAVAGRGLGRRRAVPPGPGTGRPGCLPGALAAPSGQGWRCGPP